MNWPVYITLTKLSTRDDAEYPQEDRFPSLSTVKQGYMWEYTQPKVGECFYVHQSKLYSNFRTSLVQEIKEINKNTIHLTTLNSVYELKLQEYADS